MSQFAWTFQGGRKRTVAIGAIAGNVTTNITPEAGKRWLILRVRIILTTDITVVNRYIVLSLTDGTNITQGYPFSPLTPASSVGIVNMGELRFNLNALAAGALECYLGVDPILLEGADQFRILIGAGVAGDVYGGFLDVLEVDL